MVGQSLSHFDIVAKLGHGGMGEVYRAEDTKLGRDVAIKVLPRDVSADPDRLARFEREAKVLASLNHPNIASIYQVEQAGDIRFLVMELVPGETLQQRLSRGAIPIPEALELALQIAAAIEAAHERGVIHRDLKPANVMIDPQGRLKVLDFGLAKALDSNQPWSGAPPGLSFSPTVTARMTQAGVILGTASYMSPEQARSEEADKRSDIWAFGLLLFEMLSGTRSFAGKTVTDIIAAVVTRDPDWDALPRGTPGQVRRLLVRCTRKDRDERLHDIADARIALREAIESPEEDTRRSPEGSRRVVVAATLGVLIGLVAGALLWGSLRTDTPTARVAAEPRFLNLEVPEGQTVSALGISRDGSQVWYGASESGEGGEDPPELYVRAFAETQSRAIPGTEGVSWAAFSPDGRFLAFRSQPSPDQPWRIRKVAVDGGPAIQLLDDAEQDMFMGGVWRDDGTMLIDYHGALAALPMNGGEPKILLEAEVIRDGAAQVLLGAVPLPDGDRVIVVIGYRNKGSYVAKSEVYSPATGERRALLADQGAWIVTDDALIAWTVDAMVAMPFDAERAEITGGAVPIGAASFSNARADDGTLVTSESRDDKSIPVVWTQSRGTFENVLPAGKDDVWYARWSPDGDHLALTVEDEPLRPKLYTFDLRRGELSRLGFPGCLVSEVAWSPDGRRVAFSCARDGRSERLYVRSASGNDQPAPMLDEEGDFSDEPSDWSPDGSTLAFMRHEGDGSDILLLDVESGKVRPLIDTPAFEHSAAFSPDGRWVAFESDEAGQHAVYAIRYPPVAGDPPVFRVPAGNGRAPRWSPDGTSLYFVSLDRKLMNVEVAEAGDALRFGAIHEVLDMGAQSLESTQYESWDISPDGKSMIFMRLKDERTSRGIRVMLNWDEYVRRAIRH